MKKQTNPPAAGRKLSLNKKTISNLSGTEMSRQMGGSYFQSQCRWCHYGGGNSKQCTQNQNTCPGHNTCYTCVTCV